MPRHTTRLQGTPHKLSYTPRGWQPPRREQSHEPEADIAVHTGSAAAARDRYDGWQHLILLLPLPLQPLKHTTKKVQTDNGLARCHSPQHAYE